MPNFLSPTKTKLDTPTKDVRCRCKNYPNCGRKCTLRSASLLPPPAVGYPAWESPSAMANATEDLPSDLVIGLSLVGLEKAEKEVARRKRSANDTRLTRSNNATPFVNTLTEDGFAFATTDVVILTPKSTGTLKLCSHCGSPAGPFIPTKLPKSSRTQRSLTFDSEDEILRDTSQSSDVDVVKLTPVLENFLSKKPGPVHSSPPSPIATSSPIITPERKNKLASSGLEVDATRITGEFEISACVPPSPPLPAVCTPPEVANRVKKNAHPFARRRISQRTSGRSLADRLSAIAERPPPPVEQVRGTDVISMLHERGDYGIVLSLVLSYVEEDDLCAMSCVSHSWKEVVNSQLDAMQRRADFLKIKRLWIHSPDAENSRMLRGYLRSPSVIRPRTTSEIRGYLEKALQGASAPSSSQSNASRRFSMTLGPSNKRSPRRGPHTLPRVQSESEGRFWAFVQEGQQLHQGERLAQCPVCRSPAKVIPGKVMAECTKSSCGYAFCPHCRIGSPRRCCRSASGEGEEDFASKNNGSSPAKSWRSTPSIGSRKSKKSLKRLVEK